MTKLLTLSDYSTICCGVLVQKSGTTYICSKCGKSVALAVKFWLEYIEAANLEKIRKQKNENK